MPSLGWEPVVLTTAAIPGKPRDASLLAELPDERSEQILRMMEEDESEEVRKLLEYKRFKEAAAALHRQEEDRRRYHLRKTKFPYSGEMDLELMTWREPGEPGGRTDAPPRVRRFRADPFAALRDATTRMAAHQIRNAATVGGNIASAVPCADIPPLLSLLPRSATGQPITTYFNMISRPRQPDEKDGPRAVHLLLRDNGRSRIRKDPELQETLRCIRCGACMNHCPVYVQVTAPLALSMMKIVFRWRALTRILPGRKRSSPASYQRFSGSSWTELMWVGDSGLVLQAGKSSSCSAARHRQTTRRRRSTSSR